MMTSAHVTNIVTKYYFLSVVPFIASIYSFSSSFVSSSHMRGEKEARGRRRGSDRARDTATVARKRAREQTL
jgi:hypothetical protein